MAVLLAIAPACNCGFVPVEECFPACADADGGPSSMRDGGVGDAGSDAGTAADAGLVVDAGALADAGTPGDAGTPTDAGTPGDAGRPHDGGCLDELRSLAAPNGGDYVHVSGAAGLFGVLDFIIGGYSAGASGVDGIQRFTNGAYLRDGVPPDVDDTGLWMWTKSGPVVLGVDYAGDNSSQYQGTAPFIDFRMFRAVSCPRAAGRGSFRFTSFTSPPSQAAPVEGEYAFQCLDAGIDVRGCFVYGR